MAERNWDRDYILANFQAASHIEDFGKCIEILETHDWDLQRALNLVFQEQETSSENERSKNHLVTDRATEPSFIDLDQPQAYGNHETDSAKSGKQLKFTVSWHAKPFTVSICDSETIEGLKLLLQIQTGLPLDEINLEGWPNGDSSIQDDTILSSLNLCDETHLVLHIPAKVTVSPAQFLPCNIPDLNNMTSDKEDEIDEAIPRAINVPSQPSTSKEEISLTVNHDGRDYKLRYQGNQTVKDVKQALFLLTKISTKNQQWVGWPENATNTSRLRDLGLQENHFLLFSSNETEQTTTDIQSTNPSDSGTAGSPEDTDFDEPMLLDDYYDDDAIFDADVAQSKKIKSLLPRNSGDNADAMVHFQQNFEERYGDFHPAFYVGPLKSAIEEAGGSCAKERRPLLVYLHHDGSILTNIFCSQILCSEQLVSFVSQNFVIWSWDMSHESNRQRFVNMLVIHFGNSAASTVSKYRDADYPLLLIVMKSKAGLEVCSILQGNSTLNELMISLIHGYEVFEQAKLVEVQAENERNAREEMKQEQDAAYHESLAADRAKVEAERMRQNEEIEKQRQQKLEEEIKEAERLSCADQLPDEPPSSAKNITNLRFRFPNGDRELRRFYEHDTLNVIYLYVTSKGFNTKEHRIVTNFPRRQLSEDSLQRSLKELKLCPQENLFVEEI